MITALRSVRLHRRFAGDHHQLRRIARERLPGLRLAVRPGGDDLVAERAGGEIRRNGPERGPKAVGRLTARRVRTVFCRDFLTVSQDYDDALKHLFIGHGAGLIEHADAPGDGLLALVLVLENAEWAGLSFKRMRNDVAL